MLRLCADIGQVMSSNLGVFFFFFRGSDVGGVFFAVHHSQSIIWGTQSIIWERGMRLNPEMQCKAFKISIA